MTGQKNMMHTRAASNRWQELINLSIISTDIAHFAQWLPSKNMLTEDYEDFTAHIIH